MPVPLPDVCDVTPDAPGVKFEEESDFTNPLVETTDPPWAVTFPFILNPKDDILLGSFVVTLGKFCSMSLHILSINVLTLAGLPEKLVDPPVLLA